MSMHTAGSLKEGKMVWALAKINDSFPDFQFGSVGVNGYRRDIDRIVNAVIYDSMYGGKSQTVIAVKNY
jgi:hypothetical protein